MHKEMQWFKSIHTSPQGEHALTPLHYSLHRHKTYHMLWKHRRLQLLCLHHGSREKAAGRRQNSPARATRGSSGQAHCTPQLCQTQSSSCGKWLHKLPHSRFYSFQVCPVYPEAPVIADGFSCETSPSWQPQGCSALSLPAPGC